MALDFQQVREQVKKLGEDASARANGLRDARTLAFESLRKNACEYERLNGIVEGIIHKYDPNLRCALPAQGPGGDSEPLDAHFPLPALPVRATILAADGSQIAPDRHAAVDYSLINVGSIQMRLGKPDSPELTVTSELIYGDVLYSGTGVLTDARLALQRDLKERSRLVALAEQVEAPVITFTDGPIELWGSADVESGDEFRKSLETYLQVLNRLKELGVTTAGYVDKPAANLVIRLLEVAMLPKELLAEVKKTYPLKGVSDRYLFQDLLKPGERSAIFAIQSRSALKYQDNLALHFFYLNVGRSGHSWPVRVEVPAWVAQNQEMLDNLHSVLVHQCRILANRPYPYLLHRAHEAAVVSLEEKDQVTQMIALELRQRGVEVDEISNKQFAKDAGGRTRYGR